MGDFIGISLGGLIGAIIGTIVAAFAFGPMASFVERGLKLMRGTEPQDHTSSSEIALLRRGVLAFDLLVFCGGGYWIGNVIGGSV
jgi:hypothetical protein